MSTKTEIIDIEDEPDINPLKLEEQKAKDRITRQKRLNWLFHFSLGIFCAVFVGILALIHLFFGASQVFSLKFSLPAIVEWLTLLPETPITEPEEQLTKLIIGIAFFVFYVIISIKIINATVRTIRLSSVLNDAKYGKINSQQALFTAFQYTSSSYCSALLFGLMASTSGEKQIPWGLILLFVLYGIFFVVATIKNNMDGRKFLGNGEFEKKDVVWDTVKDVLLVIFATALIIVCLQPQFLVFAQNIRLHFKTTERFTGVAIIERFILPFFKLFLAFTSVLLFRQTLLISRRKKAMEAVSFYGQTYQFATPLTPFQKKAKGRMVRIIMFSVICCLLSLFFVLWTTQGFKAPDDIGALVIDHLIYPIAIGLAITTYVLLKKKENRISKFQAY